MSVVPASIPQHVVDAASARLADLVPFEQDASKRWQFVIAAALDALMDDEPVALPAGWRGQARPSDVLAAVLGRP